MFLKLLASTPYSQIKVTQICQEADIVVATFYLHFKNYDVLDDVLEEAMLMYTLCRPLVDLERFFRNTISKEPLCRLFVKIKIS